MQLFGVRLSVCLSVCPIQPPYTAAAGLLLRARQAECVDRLLQLWWTNAGSAMLSTHVITNQLNMHFSYLFT